MLCWRQISHELVTSQKVVPVCTWIACDVGFPSPEKQRIHLVVFSGIEQTQVQLSLVSQGFSHS